MKPSQKRVHSKAKAKSGLKPRPETGAQYRAYRGTSLIRNTPLLGPYSRTLPGVIGLWAKAYCRALGGCGLLGEVPL